MPDRQTGGRNPHGAIARGTVLVCSGLVTPGADLTGCLAALSEEERVRAARFRTPQLRDVYVAAHGTLRRMLSEALEVRPQALSFVTNPWGKPALSGTGAGLHFNISHSGNRFLLALSTAPVGIDIEKVADDVPDDIVADVMTLAEQSLLKRLPACDRRQVFYDLWVRKEAVAKAVGRGLDIDLAKIAVSSGIDGDVGSAVLAETPLAEAIWNIIRLPRIEGFAAALAAQHCDFIHFIEATLD